MTLSSADHGVVPPHVSFPDRYNAAADLIGRNLEAGRGAKPAVIDDRGSTSYADLAARVDRFAGALTALGIARESRVALVLLDSVDFPTAFLGAIKAGLVPVPLNTLLTPDDYRFMLSDSRASALVVSAPLLDKLRPLLGDLPDLQHVIVADGPADIGLGFDRLRDGATPLDAPAPTRPDDFCFWLYSSGSTGRPKGAVHIQTSLVLTAELYARPVLGIHADDVVFSAAKLFFAYGLGNGLSFPFSVGATAVLMAERPTPAAVSRVLREQRPTIFYGVPTLFGALLASPDLPGRGAHSLRIATSAGEALPEDLGRRWLERVGVDILDGIGSTEMLHIYLSNRPGEVRYGTSGRAVPGYTLRVVDERGQDVADGQSGELLVSGPTSAALYWNNRARSRRTFQGEWTATGDKYTRNADGTYTYGGRGDDMLKVGGIYVSPFEVETALLSHTAVLEAAVVGRADEQGLIKPMAFVVLKPGIVDPDLAEVLRLHVKERLAPYKYPRWIEFVDELPKTATGKIQRFKLRARFSQPA